MAMNLSCLMCKCQEWFSVMVDMIGESTLQYDYDLN